MLNLEPIKARLAAATPGPWRANQFHDEDPNPLNHTLAEGSWDVKAGDDIVICDVIDDRDRENAKLIASAPDDLAALVAEVEKLRAVVNGCASAFKKIGAPDEAEEFLHVAGLLASVS